MSFNPSFSMEWSGTLFRLSLFSLSLPVSILVFQWNGLELDFLILLSSSLPSFNPSFSMECSGSLFVEDAGNQWQKFQS